MSGEVKEVWAFQPSMEVMMAEETDCTTGDPSTAMTVTDIMMYNIQRLEKRFEEMKEREAVLVKALVSFVSSQKKYSAGLAASLGDVVKSGVALNNRIVKDWKLEKYNKKEN